MRRDRKTAKIEFIFLKIWVEENGEKIFVGLEMRNYLKNNLNQKFKDRKIEEDLIEVTTIIIDLIL